MGPITIEAIIGDGALFHPDRECAPEASWPCEKHGQWACNVTGCGDEEGDYGVVFSTDSLDGSECCNRCTMPLDQAAFDFWQEQEVEKDHKSGGHKRARELGLSRDAVDCRLCDDEDDDFPMDDGPAEDACSICHASEGRCNC